MFTQSTLPEHPVLPSSQMSIPGASQSRVVDSPRLEIVESSKLERSIPECSVKKKKEPQPSINGLSSDRASGLHAINENDLLEAEESDIIGSEDPLRLDIPGGGSSAVRAKPNHGEDHKENANGAGGRKRQKGIKRPVPGASGEVKAKKKKRKKKKRRRNDPFADLL